MNIFLIEAVLDRYLAKVKRSQKQWTTKGVETLLLRLREEVLECLK